LGIKIVKVAGSLREGTFLEKSLLIVTLVAVSILEFKFFFLLSPKENKDKASGKAFLEVEEVETLFKKCLVM